MVNIRLATEEDKEGWNRVAYESPEATYAHSWEWKEVLEKGLELETLYLLAEDRDEIVGIYPSFISPLRTKNILLKRYNVLFSPFDQTWDYGGPCILPNADKRILEELIIKLEKISKRESVLSLRISPFEGEYLKEILALKCYRLSPRLTSIIDLTKSEEELWHRVKKNARRYINKPRREGVTVVERNDEAGLKEFYMCMEDLGRRNEMYLPPFLFFKTILDIMMPKKMAKYHVVKYEGEVIGGSLSLYFKDIVTFRYGSGLESYQHLYPHYILHWVRIVESKNLGYKKIDLGGMPSDKNSGVHFFKSRWGGEIKNVDWYVKDIRFRKIRKIKRNLFTAKSSISFNPLVE